jgi:type IV pilus assembly protein PilP
MGNSDVMKHQNLSTPSHVPKLILVLATLFLSACQDGKPNLEQYVATVKAQKAPEIEPLPKIKPYEKFVYSVSEERNPFMKTVIEPEMAEQKPVVDNGIWPDKHRLKEELESYPLAELQFVGTLGKEFPWALIRTSDGVIHRVRIGNYLGSYDGEILSINDMEIALKEIVPDGNGAYIERESTLTLVDLN